ncbi:MAG: sulfur carrier protein ThiS [Candidatus Omnitrophota bacterium]
MNIVVNGTSNIVNEEISLKQFIEKHCPNPERVIAEVNEHIVKRADWDRQLLKENDKLELITFVGGG